jgi:hypothetical protein
MSFIVVATEVFGAGLAAEIAAGALMGGSITIGANVLRGKNPFDNIGQGLLLGGLTAGISSGLGNSLSSAGVTENAAQEAVRTGSLTPDLAGPNINSLGNSVESSYANAIPAPPSAPPGGLESLAPAPATPMPSGGYPVGSAEYLNAEAGLSTATPIPSTPVSYPPGSAEYLNAEASTVGGPAAPSASTTPSSATPSSAAPSDATTPADFNRNRISPASDYKGTLRSSGLPSLNQAGQFAKDNWRMLTGIAAIGLLNQPKPGVNVPTRDPGGFHTGYYDPITHRMVDTGGYVSYKDFGDKNIRDYTHARNGGLMGLANGGAVAFADGGVNMTSPFMNALAHPETIPLQYGETQDQGLARIQAQQDELNLRVQNRMAMNGEQPQTVNWTQSPAGLNPSSPSVQTQADVDYWTKRAADAQGSPFVAGGGGGSQDNGQRQVDFIKSLMANNPAPIGPTNAQMQYDAQTEQARTKANREAVGMYQKGDGFQVSNGYIGRDPLPNESAVVVTDANGTPRYLTNDEVAKQKAYADSLFDKYKPVAPTTNMPNTPAAGGNPPDREKAQGIQTLVKPDVPRPTAQTDGPPITRSGIEQLVHGAIYDPATGRFRNPTLDEIGARNVTAAKGNSALMKQLYDQYFDSYKPGEKLDFAGGTLTKNADGTATHTYIDANGKQQSYTFSKGTSLATVAASDPAIAQEWKSMFDYNVPVTPHVSGPSVPTGGTSGTTTPHPTGPSVPTGGTSGTTTPHPTGPVLTPGTGSAGSVTQVPTGFTPPTAPTTRVPTSIEDFNKRFNTMTPGGDSEAMDKYLMGEGPEPKGTTNTEVAAPYWEKMGMAPVDKTRSSRIYDPNLKNAAGKVVGGYVTNPDFKPKVFDPVTKRLIDAPSSTSGSGSGSGSGSSSSSTPGQPTTAQLNDKTTIPSQSPGVGNRWVWIDNPGAKHWVSVPIDTGNGQQDTFSGAAATGGLMHSYAGGGLGSLGGYSDGGRLLRGPGDGVSDSIPASIGNRQPARLADGEFVVPARIVSELGNGSTEAGARRLYQMMDRVQNARKKSIGKNKVATNSRAQQYLPV